MATKGATNRLNKEYKAMVANPPPYIVAHPSERNILQWHYIITGPPDTPYHNGQYHGLVIFPRDYPYKPPEIRMLTPNGRFAVNTRLCLSMSDYHPDTWQPAWSVATILTGLLSFMTGDEPTTGSINTSEETKRRFARASLEWNAKNNAQFQREFPELIEENLKTAQEWERKEKEAEKKRKQEEEEELLRAAALRTGIDVDKMDPEDRIRYLAAQAQVQANNAESKYAYWACYALAVAVLVGFVSVIN